jgi:hypothetical protein
LLFEAPANERKGKEKASSSRDEEEPTSKKQREPVGLNTRANRFDFLKNFVVGLLMSIHHVTDTIRGRPRNSSSTEKPEQKTISSDFERVEKRKKQKESNQ